MRSICSNSLGPTQKNRERALRPFSRPCRTTVESLREASETVEELAIRATTQVHKHDDKTVAVWRQKVSRMNA